MNIYLIIVFVILLFTVIISYGIGWEIGRKDTLKTLLKKNVITQYKYDYLTKVKTSLRIFIMHDRNMHWKTADGRVLELKNITTAHLCNIIKHINNHWDEYIFKYEEDSIKKCMSNLNQELRLRKLNRLEIEIENETELF
jgi:hypothetical protein